MAMGSKIFVSPTKSLHDIPKPQKLTPIKALSFYINHYPEKEGMARAYLSGHYTLSEVGAVYSKSSATVSRAVKLDGSAGE